MWGKVVFFTEIFVVSTKLLKPIVTNRFGFTFSLTNDAVWRKRIQLPVRSATPRMLETCRLDNILCLILVGSFGGGSVTVRKRRRQIRSTEAERSRAQGNPKRFAHEAPRYGMRGYV